MSITAWIIMGLAWAGILTLFVFCMYRTLTSNGNGNGKHNHSDSTDSKETSADLPSAE